MGDQYLQVCAAANLSELSGNAFRVLCRMAVVVFDEDTEDIEEGLYFGGWKGLTAVLGYGIYDRDDVLPPAVEQKIRRAIRELRDAGYISVADRRYQHGHHNRVYRIHLARVPIV